MTSNIAIEDPFYELKCTLMNEANTRKVLEEAQLVLDTFEANCALDIRESYSGKITENTVKEHIAINEDLIALKQQMIEAQYAYDLAKVESEISRTRIKYHLIALQQPAQQTLPRLY